MKFIRYHNSPPYNPSASYTTLRDEMDRLFTAAFPQLSEFQRNGVVGGDFPVDLYQEKEAFIVRAELPGFRKEDLAVEVAEGILTVTGHQKNEAPVDAEKKTVATTQERKVTRSVSLPDHLQVEKIEATYEN